MGACHFLYNCRGSFGPDQPTFLTPALLITALKTQVLLRSEFHPCNCITPLFPKIKKTHMRRDDQNMLLCRSRSAADFLAARRCHFLKRPSAQAALRVLQNCTTRLIARFFLGQDPCARPGAAAHHKSIHSVAPPLPMHHSGPLRIAPYPPAAIAPHASLY